MFEDRQASYGYPVIYTRQEAPAGSTVFEDPANKLASIVYPDGSVRIWSGYGTMDVKPRDGVWRMEWRHEDEDLDNVVLMFEASTDEDEAIAATGYELYTERMEGHEDRFAEFVRLARDRRLNPVGLPLKSGVYAPASGSERFRVDFGGTGNPPSFAPVPETMPAELDFPYRTVLVFEQPVETPKGTIEPGDYVTVVRSFRIKTGEVLSIECRGENGRGNITGEQLVAAIAAGQVVIAKVIEDHRPHY